MASSEYEEKAGRRQPDLMTERNVADRWQVSCRTLQRWRSEGFGPAWIWIGGSVRYRFGDVLAYEERNRRGRGTE